MEMILLTLIKTHGGDIKGYTKKKINYFLGIPYANQPINEHRFKHSKCLKLGIRPLKQHRLNLYHHNPTTNSKPSSHHMLNYLIKVKTVYI